MPDDLRHLLVTGVTEAHDFKSTLSVHKQPAPQQHRRAHGTRLLRELAAVAAEADALRIKRFENGVDPDAGTAISLEVSPPGTLDPSQFEWRRDGIEVLNAIRRGDTEVVTLLVPEGKLSAFERRVRDYLEKEVKPRKEGAQAKPANANLVNAIHSFKRAAFEQLWTELSGAAPPEDESWFQIWLRRGTLSAAEAHQRFREAAAHSRWRSARLMRPSQAELLRWSGPQGRPSRMPLNFSTSSPKSAWCTRRRSSTWPS